MQSASVYFQKNKHWVDIMVSIFKNIKKMDLQTIKFFDHLLQASADGILITDNSQNIIVANSAFCSFLGESVNNVVATSLFTWLDQLEDNAAKFWTEIEKRVRSDGSYHDAEFRVMTDGTDLWLNVNASILEQVGTEEKGVILSIWRDISRRKKIEKELEEYRNHLEEMVDFRTEELQQEIIGRKKIAAALKKSEITARAMLNATTESIFLIKPDGTFILLNDVTAKRFGKIPDELIGKCSYDFVPPDLAASRKKQIEKLIATDRPVRFKDTRSGIIFDSCLYPLHDSNGKINRIAVFGRDITVQEQAKKALEASEKKYRTMMEAMKDAAYITSSDYHIQYMNPRMISRIGHDATGERCHKAIHGRNEKCDWCVFDKVHKGEHVDYEFYDPNDNQTYLITNSPVFHVKGVISKLSIWKNITRSKENEARLRQVYKMESIGTLAGGIAHDFNNLLYMVVGNTELALEDIPKWHPAYESLEEIKSASLKAAGIVKQLLNFSKNADQEFKPIGIVDTVKEAIELLRSTIPSTIEMRADFSKVDVPILGDPVQIHQIMMNLCANASNAMKRNGGILKIDLKTLILDNGSAEKNNGLSPGKYVKISVSDNGKGILDDILPRIFDPYFTTQEFGQASGMGLAIVKGNVENHHGIITVKSRFGKGTVFKIWFPVIDEQTEADMDTEREIPFGTGTILFVDDEKMIARMSEKILKRFGFTVKICLSPVAALDLFQSEPDRFDMVITDMTMPHMDGIQLFQEIKKIRSDIPVLISTGHSAMIDEDKASRLGFDGYILKPVSKSKLANAIKTILKEQRV